MISINKDLHNEERGRGHEVFEQLVKKHLNAVCATAYHILGDFYLAQDIAQEVFIKAYLNLEKLHSLEKVGSWLYSTTRTTCIDWLRKFGGVKTLGGSDAVDSLDLYSAGDITHNTAIKVEVERALNTLSEEERLVIILYCVSGYKAREIASFTGIPQKTVETRIRRAKQKLKNEMLDMVEQSLKISTSEGDLQKLLISIFEKAKKYNAAGKQKKALEEIQKAAQHAPEDIGVRLMLANKLLVVGYAEDNIEFLKEAEKEFQNILSKGDTWLKDYVYNGLGQTYYNMKEYDKAIEYYKKMLVGKGVNGFLGLGQALRGKGDYDEATKVFQGIAHNALFELLLSLGELSIISSLKGDLCKAVLYNETSISILENLKGESRTRRSNWNTFLRGAKLQLRAGNKNKALDYLHKAREYAKLDYEYNNPTLLFDKLEVSIGRTSEKTCLEWLLEALEGESFRCLKQEQDFINLISMVKADIQAQSKTTTKKI